MSEKRRDNKNRILLTGESQRTDGRYTYKYTDATGIVRNIYSWRLTAADKLPEGKRPCEPLRDLEKKIQEELQFGLIPNGGGMTVVQLCEMYLKTKTNTSENTRAGYQTTLKLLNKHPFGAIRIDKVKMLDARLFLVSLQKEYHKKYSSISSVRGVLRPAFRLAVQSDYIKKNPFDFELKEVLVNDSVTRDALSRKDEQRFLKFVKEDEYFSQYYDAILILFKTGLRISEFCGLTLSDIDLKQKRISINHQLQRKKDGTLYIINDMTNLATTKTKAGTRDIPITEEVCSAFKNLIELRKTYKIEPIVDGYSRFLILNTNVRKDIRPMVAMDWEHIFKRIWTKHNSIYKKQLPLVTPHVCRHTYCSNQAKSGMNPATLQFLMGHSDISVTMKNYVHIKTEDAQEELNRLDKQQKRA